MSLDTGIRLVYLIAAICFILALKGLSGPKTARMGNLVGAAGMLLAVGMTFATPGLSRFALMVGAMAIGVVHRLPRSSPREDDGDTADGGRLQRSRRRCGGANRPGGVREGRTLTNSPSTRWSRSCSG